MVYIIDEVINFKTINSEPTNARPILNQFIGLTVGKTVLIRKGDLKISAQFEEYVFPDLEVAVRFWQEVWNWDWNDKEKHPKVL